MKDKLTDLDWYQDNPSSYTVFVFGEIFSDKRPLLQNLLLGKSAYEAYSLYWYLKEVTNIRGSDNLSSSEWAGRFFALYAALNLFQGERCEFAEMGSTLFASIDKINAIHHAVQHKIENLQNVEFVGVEKSDFFADVAEVLHPNVKITHFDNWTGVHAPVGNRVGVSYQAASYAFDSTDDLVSWLTQFRFSIDCIFFSTQKITEHVTALGKRYTLFNLDEFLEKMKDRKYTVSHISTQKVQYPYYSYYAIWFVTHNLSEEETGRFEKYIEQSQPVGMNFSINLNGGFESFTPDVKPFVHQAQHFDSDQETLGMVSNSWVASLKNWWSTAVLRRDPVRLADKTQIFDFGYPNAYRLLAEHIFSVGQREKALSLLDVWRKGSNIKPDTIGRRNFRTIALSPPYVHNGGYCWTLKLDTLQVGYGDSVQNSYQSDLVLLENGMRLGPSHEMHDKIRSIGLGSYSYWDGMLYFSSSDDTDPNKNGRKYSIMVPK